MKKFKLSSLALASALILTSGFTLVGCGSDDDSTESTVINLSELDQAKKIINTAKTFVSDSKLVQTAYENVSEIFTDQQNSRLGYTLGLPEGLVDYMNQNEKSVLTAADIRSLANDSNFQQALSGITLQPEDDFIAAFDQTGKFTLSGTTSVTTSGEDSFEATYNGLELVFNPENEDDLTLNFDSVKFGSVSTGTGTESDEVILSSGIANVKVNGKIATENANEEFDVNEESPSNTDVVKTEISLNGLQVKANDSVIKASNFEFAEIEITNTFADELVYTSLPYKLSLTGNLTKETPATDLEITLNARLKDANVKSYITNTQQSNFDETDEEIVGITFVLSIKGNVAKSGSATIPLDFQAQLERTVANVIELKELKAKVDGKELFITGQTNFDTNNNVIGTQLVIKQVNTSITLKLDENGEFIKTGNKLADIFVNDTDYGDLIDNAGKITAQFNDNSVIIL